MQSFQALRCPMFWGFSGDELDLALTLNMLMFVNVNWRSKKALKS